MTPLVPIFRANLPEEWNLFFDIHLDGDTPTIFCLMSSVVTALAMTSHKANRVGYIPGQFPVDEKLVARKLTQNNLLEPLLPVRKLQFQGLIALFPMCGCPKNPSGRKTPGFR